MKISNLPSDPIVESDGTVSNSWRSMFSQLVNQIQEFLSDESYNLPQPDATRLSELNIKKHEGGLLYDSQTKAAKVNTANNYSSPETYTLKTLVTYEELTSAEVAAIPANQRNGRIIYETNTGSTKLGSNQVFITL